MSKEEFKASNGYTITEVSGAVRIIDDAGDNSLIEFNYLDPLDMDALSEYVRAKDDERLGRWRHPDYPTYAVYRHHENWVIVVEEESGLSTGHARYAVRHPNFVSTTEKVARLYYDAHPKPKPWHDAKEGEVWVITYEGNEYPAIFQAGKFRDHGGSWDAESVTAGRRIYPTED